MEDFLELFSLQLSFGIRFCREEDLQGLEWWGWMTPQRETIRTAFDRHRRGEVLMLVAAIHDYPVGQAWVDLRVKKTQSVGVIWAMRVIPPLRGAGLGSRLIACAEQALLERGFEEAELGVEKNNPDAQRLYLRLGYQPAGEEMANYVYFTQQGKRIEERIDQILLRKRLNLG